VLGGRVQVAGLRVDKAGAAVDPAAPIEVEGGLPYVGRGGLKLAEALDRFEIAVEGLVAVDVGASTEASPTACSSGGRPASTPSTLATGNWPGSFRATRAWCGSTG